MMELVEPAVLACKRVLDTELPYGSEDFAKQDIAMKIGLKLMELGYIKYDTVFRKNIGFELTGKVKVVFWEGEKEKEKEKK